MLSKAVPRFCLARVKVTGFCLASVPDWEADQARSELDSGHPRSSGVLVRTNLSVWCGVTKTLNARHACASLLLPVKFV